MFKCAMRFALILALFGLAGCAAMEPKPLTPEQQALQEAKSSCLQRVMVMDSDRPVSEASVFNSLSMTSSFQWCMQNYGFSQEEIDSIWY